MCPTSSRDDDRPGGLGDETLQPGVPAFSANADAGARARDDGRGSQITSTTVDGETLPAAFGRYTVDRVLGSGGYGIVFLGHDPQLDRKVAIKICTPDLPPSEVEQFLNEARRIARLNHPGIVTVHDVGVQGGQVYMVSDYISGPSLSEWLRAHRPTWQEAAKLAASIADALAHAHARLTLHRDIKPANILLADVGPVLVDFGLGLDETRTGGLERGVVSGTPHYMSPEQISGQAHRIDGRIDIYGLGVVLYEMLCGLVPFRADNLKELFRQICDDQPQPPRQLVSDIPVELERICHKALQKQMQDRYSTAADFADDLRRVYGAQVQHAASYDPASSVAIQPPAATAQSPITPQPAAVSSRSSARRPLEAERRQVTMLLCGCKVFDSEEFLGLDVEDQDRLLRSFQERAELVVLRLDGSIVQRTDQGVLACFGYPVAHEDAVGRALRAAQEIVESTASTKPAAVLGTLRLEPSIAIHTGAAIVEMKEVAISVVGEARTVVGRLGEIAKPGQIVCSETTLRLLRARCTRESLGKHALRGVPEPLEVFLVSAIGGPALDAEAEARLTPLSGREHEVNLLKDRWERAQDGLGQVVLIVGEPGMGKSRLVSTMKEHVQRQSGDSADSPIVEWRCAPHCQNSPLHPAIEFLEQSLGFLRDEPAHVRLDKLVRHLDQHGLAEPDTVPLFVSLLGLPSSDRFPGIPLPSAREKEETMRALGELLRAYSTRRPILFIVEDLHWIDPSTLEFLQTFLAEGTQDEILTLLTFRSDFETPLAGGANHTSLSLSRLTQSQVGEIMRHQTGSDFLPQPFIDQVFDRTGGVPLFVEEFTKMAKESGVLSRIGPDSVRTRAVLDREIPASLQDLLMARLDRSTSDRDVVQIASALGREFSYELIAAVATLDEPTLQSELEGLVLAGLLHRKGRPEKGRYVFKHALVQDAAYNSLVKSRRQQLHARIAQVLDERFSDVVEKQPELLARHYAQGGQIEKAVEYWLKAGLQSRARSADHEAIAQLNEGLTLLDGLDPTPDRERCALQFLTSMAPAYISIGGYCTPEAEPILARARALAERVGQRSQLFGIMLGTWEWRLVRGELRPCVALAADGMTLAEQLGDAGMLMEALFMPGVTQYYRGEFVAARECLEKAVSNYDDIERTKQWSVYTGHNASVTHRCYLALTLWHLGYADRALQISSEMRALARTIGHAFSLAHAVDFTACLHYHCRIAPEVESASAEELAIAADQRFQFWEGLGTLNRTSAMVLQGRGAEAIPGLLEGLEAFRATGARLRVPYYLCMLGEAYLQAGRLDDAEKAFGEGLAVVEGDEERTQEAEFHRLTGELILASTRDEAAAEASFLRAITTARHQQSKAWELRATMSLARLWQRQKRSGDSRKALGDVYSTFTEGWTTPDLVEASALLASFAR